MTNHIGIFDSKTARLVLTIPSSSRAVPQLRFTTEGSLISVDSLGVRTWDSQHSYDPAARSLARSVLRLDVGQSPGSIQLVDEIAEGILARNDIDAEIKRAAIQEVQQIGDRDLNGMCRASREIVLRGDDPVASRRALKMAHTVARFAPWSDYCRGVLGMAKYRTGDYRGALDTLSALAAARGPSDSALAELAFRAMALHHLGSPEAAMATSDVRARAKDDQSAAELSTILAELNSLTAASKR